MTANAALHPLDLIVLVGYFVAVVAIGFIVGRFTKTTHDFFLAGQRFSWWLVAISCVATLVGAYSFVIYSESGFRYGLCLLYPYMNEWFVLPLFLAGWLPIIYYSRVQSIPEYFERRFDRRTRTAVLILLLVYLEAYIGINLLSIGTLLEDMFGWNILISAAATAVVVACYVHAGGQTSAMIVDLLQGFWLLAAGILVLFLGIHFLGGFEVLWSGLPAEHRLPFAQFNQPTGYNAVGDFWGDAIVGTFAFYMINQGVLMRFLSARSVREGRRAMFFTVMVLMPIAAVAVTGAGWVGRAMATHEMAPLEQVTAWETSTDPAEIAKYESTARNIFAIVARTVCRPGVFGLVIAAVIAALLSTLDTLITGATSICINDVLRPLRPGRDDAYYLRAARLTSIVVTGSGVALIPVFMRSETIYQALSLFTSLISPPLVVVVCLGVVWRGFSARSAFWTLVVGSAAMLVSLIWPQLVAPFAHGTEPDRYGDYPYMRALYGLVACGTIAAVISWLDGRSMPRESTAGREGLDINTLDEARAAFKGGVPSRRGIGSKAVLPLRIVETLDSQIRLPAATMQALQAEPGDLVFVGDSRWWLGGLRSVHARLGPAAGPEAEGQLLMSAACFGESSLLSDRPVRVEKLI